MLLEVAGKVKLVKQNESKKHVRIKRACRKCESCRRENCGVCRNCQVVDIDQPNSYYSLTSAESDTSTMIVFLI